VTSRKTEEVTDAAPLGVVVWAAVVSVTVVGVVSEVCVDGVDSELCVDGVVGGDVSSVASELWPEQRDTRHSAPISRTTRTVFIVATLLVTSARV
jgi:hypothetical protein